MEYSANKYNKIVNPLDFESPEFQLYMKKACGREVIPSHRKYWEWGMAYRLMEEYGFLTPGMTTLGLGTGYEPLAFIISEFVDLSIRSDYVSEENNFMKQYGKEVANINDRPTFLPKNIYYNPEKVKFIPLDATDMSAIQSESVDVVYSISSIEHFGDRRQSPPHGAIKCMQESERVLKRGGVCIGATELQLTPLLHPEFFRKEDFIAEIIESHSMKPIEAFDFTVPDEMLKSKYYFPTILKSVFEKRGDYHGHMGVVSGNQVVVSIFYAFIKE